MPQLALGCAPLANLYGPVSDAQAEATIHAALDAGVTLFDTAPLYGAGLSETRLGAALRGVPREHYQISTKVGRMVQPDGSVVFDWSTAGIQRSIDASLARLGVAYLDIVHLHDPDAAYETALHQALPTLEALRTAGVLGTIGAGMNQWQMLDQFVATGRLGAVLLAGRYTLLEQRATPLLQRCAAAGVRVLLGGVFNSGILATGAVPGAKYNYEAAPAGLLARVARIDAICAGYGVPLATAAIQFAASHPAVDTLVVGASAPGEITAAMTALHTTVPESLWQQLAEREGIVRG